MPPVMRTGAWYSHYDDDVRPSLQPYPERTLLDSLGALARDHPRRASILFKGATLTFADIDRLSTACGAALVEEGVTPGDRVALVLSNCPQFIIAELGAWKAGTIVVPLNPTYAERELESRFTSTRPRLIVSLTPFYGRVVRAAAQSAQHLGTPRTRVIATSIKEYLPPLTRLLFTMFRERRDGHRISLEFGDCWLSRLLYEHRLSERPGVSVGPDDRAVILSSGGTTGTPKGVVGLHRHYITAGTQVDEWTRSARAPFTDVVMLPLPLFHVYANVGVQPLAFLTPSPLSLIPNPRDVHDVLTTIRRVRPTCFSGVPALYLAMLNHPAVHAGRVNLQSLKICVSGSAPLLADTKRQFEARTGARLVEGYALTESMMAACLNSIRV